MTAGPDISAVVITYNSAHVIDGLLDSLPGALDGLSAEVIVVDNGSTDGTAERAEAHGGCVVIRGTNVGYAAGINRGAEAATGDAPILVLNPDVRMHAGSVRRMHEALEPAGVGVVAPRIYGNDGVLTHSLRREPSLLRATGLTFTRFPQLSEYWNRPEDYETADAVDWALGAVLLVKRSCFDALGGWDASFFLYSEETDFCLRARDAGWITVYEPSAGADHIGQQSGYGDATHSMHTVNRVRLFHRRHGALQSYIYLLLMVGAEGYRALLGRKMHWHATQALLIPARRPPEINCSDHLLPR